MTPRAYARSLQAAVLERTRLHCSVGIGDTLVRAKNATDFGKPRGTFRLTAENWLEVMGERPTQRALGSRRQDLEAAWRDSASGPCTSSPSQTSQRSRAEFGPRMGPWYRQLGRGDGSSVVDPTPWVPRGHSRETTYQQDLAERGQIEDAARELIAQVMEDVAAEDRPVVGVGLKVRYAPFVTKTFTHKIAETFDPQTVAAEIMGLVAKIEPDRPVRLLGVRAEMAMPGDAREGHTPTRSGW